MARAYPGYVYQPYPKMIGDSSAPLGYRIVKTEEEHQAFLKSLEPVKEVSAPKSKKLKYSIEE
jgi:hypothetical protein